MLHKAGCYRGIQNRNQAVRNTWNQANLVKLVIDRKIVSPYLGING